MDYRINYGNGQVSRTFTGYATARRELLELRDDTYARSFRIQRYDGGAADEPGTWVGLGKAGRLAFEGREGLS